MLKVENLVKKYGGATALSGISFSVEAGEVVGFLGPNGAGKSTTMNIITGFISSNVGNVWIDGTEILENPTEAKKKIGYLPEQPPLYPEMTVGEYLNFVYELRACTLPRKAHLAEVMAATRITDVKDRVIRNLSKGYKQRVGLAQALVVAPCTGATLARLAAGLSDTPVTLAAKSLLRVGSPVVLAVSTNDGLGASGENMARLCQRKHYYFVPYGQDDPFAKPQSLKADLALLPAAVDAALRGEQLQPVLLGQRNA